MFDTRALMLNDMRSNYQDALSDQLAATQSESPTIDENNNIIEPIITSADTAAAKWEQLQKNISSAAASTIGHTRNHHLARFNCPAMAKLSAEQRELKLRAYNTKGKKKKQQIKQQRSHILHQLNKQAKLIDRQ